MNQRLTFRLALFLSLAVTLHAQSTKKEAKAEASAKADDSASGSDSDEKESKYGEKTFAGLELRASEEDRLIGRAQSELAAE